MYEATNTCGTVSDSVEIDIINSIQNSEEPTVEIYPNPTSNFVTINGIKLNTTLDVMNALGQKVLTTKVTSHQHMLDVSSLSNGIYWVVDRNQKEFSYKLIVSH